MPVSISKLMKISTPRQIVPAGSYPGLVVGVMYSKDSAGHTSKTHGQYLLQVKGPKGIFYVPTFPFDVSFNETGSLYKILKNFAGANSSQELLEKLDEMGYIGNDTFDEGDFIGTTVTANIAVRELYNGKKCNTVSSFGPADSSNELQLDTAHMIPYCFANSKKYDLVYDEALTVDTELQQSK